MTKSSKPESTKEAHATPEAHGPAARRRLLSGGALAAAAGLLGVVAAACGDSKDSDGGGSGGKGNAGGNSQAGATSGKGGTSGGGRDGGGGAGGGGSSDPDAEQLNTLLSNEYYAVSAYSAAIGLVSDAPPTDPLVSEREILLGMLSGIQAQHRLHASALVDELNTLGATPVTEASVVAKFRAPEGLIANTSISNTLKFVAATERAGAIAHNQALASMMDAELRYMASSIEGARTQHMVVLTVLVAALVAPGPNLDKTRAGALFPASFVQSFGKGTGLDKTPADYYP
ncbi:MAG: ferritin-like domain-containing protein [Myxococcota bacterium]